MTSDPRFTVPATRGTCRHSRPKAYVKN
jgi:hypothetical protein